MGNNTNMFGLKRGTVKLMKHSSEWGKVFRVEKVRLIKALGELIVDIQHAGSTAIPSIPAKPIIDIAVLVNSLKKVKKYIKRIEALGYKKKQENRTERLFFTKGPEANRVVYLHIGGRNTDYIRNIILFRDYLRKNLTAAKKYAKLKQELAEKFPNNREYYTVGKEKIISQMLKKIKKYHRK